MVAGDGTGPAVLTGDPKAALSAMAEILWAVLRLPGLRDARGECWFLVPCYLFSYMSTHLEAIPEDVTGIEAGAWTTSPCLTPLSAILLLTKAPRLWNWWDSTSALCACTLLPFWPLGSDLQTYDKFLSKTRPLAMDFILQVSEMSKDQEPLIQWRPCVTFWYPNSWRKVYLRQEWKPHELHRLHTSPFHWGQN